MKKAISSFLLCFLFIYSNTYSQETGRVAIVADQMPMFIGGEEALMKYVEDNIKYPYQAKIDGKEGNVYVGFIVDSTGKVTEAKVLKGQNAAMNAEALRVVNSMPLWKPGSAANKAVNVPFVLPIRFSLTVPDKKNKSK